MLSVLGTCIEASPRALAAQGHAAAIADGMLDLLSLEMDHRRSTTQAQMDSALEVNTKLPQLRRASLLLLILLVRGTTHQLQERREAEESSSLSAWPEETPRLEQLRMPGGSTLGPFKRGPVNDSRDVLSVASSGKPLVPLFPGHLLSRTEHVAGYVAQLDTDSLARHQASELVNDIETLKIERVQSGGSV